MPTKIQDYANGTQMSEKTEYIARPERRKYSNAYKRRIVKEAAECAYGETGAFLRREGLYSSQLTDWRRQELKGELSENRPKKQGRKKNTQTGELAMLRQENVRRWSSFRLNDCAFSQIMSLYQSELTILGAKFSRV